MKIQFYKYQGTGNDFIMIDQRNVQHINHQNQNVIAHLCDRRFGIGADGLILLENSEQADFKMVYFNSDGNQSTMCGNGGRCIVSFAHNLSIFEQKTIFEAIDGLHHGEIMDNKWVRLGMINVEHINKLPNGDFMLNTGSPHYVQFCNETPEDIKTEGKKIRYSEPFAKDGVNVNFVVKSTKSLQIATYERGVEDETLSCGTGVTAAAVCSTMDLNDGIHKINVVSKGGELAVELNKKGGMYLDISLIGPASFVYEGSIEI
jgi:diaminopimelate epimerase